MELAFRGWTDYTRMPRAMCRALGSAGTGRVGASPVIALSL